MDRLIANCLFAAVLVRVDNAKREGGYSENCEHCQGTVWCHARGGKIDFICRWCGRKREL